MSDNKIYIQPKPILPVDRTGPDTNKLVEPGGGSESFAEVLKNVIGQGELKFSKHAVERMRARNIQISDHELNLIADAVERASQKGVKDSLVLMDNLALVVNVKNRVVITAVNGPNIKQNIFTNIDGAVII